MVISFPPARGGGAGRAEDRYHNEVNGLHRAMNRRDVDVELEGPRSAIAAQLIDLEAGLRQLDLWSDVSPSQEALTSEQPFAMDSLEFEEWLQFIFLPTIYDVLESGVALPERCAIAPMAEETVGKKALPTESLISTLRELDQLITECD